MPSKNRFRFFWDKAGSKEPHRKAFIKKRNDRAAKLERLLALEPRMLLATYLVNNAAANGIGSFRQAILDTNANPGTDTILFGAGLSGATITPSPSAPLPAITGPVAIDASSLSTRPTIEGRFAGGGAGGLVLDAPATIRGLAIVGFDIAGITINAGASGSVVQGNYLGVLADGATRGVNPLSYGLSIASSNNTIGGPNGADSNVISGTSSAGIYFASGTGNSIIGNNIGLNRLQTAAVGNYYGVSFSGGSNNTLTGNVISGNSGPGISVGTGASAEVLVGNVIGLASLNGAVFGNAGAGVELKGPNNTIGLNAVNGGNVIAGNGGYGIVLTSSGNLILQDAIGTDAIGASNKGNAQGGIFVGADANTIGGTGGALTRNVISGNFGPGVNVAAGTGNVISGNYIGVTPDGTGDLGNTSDGVYLGTSNNVVGGTVAGAGNVLSGAGDPANIYAYGVRIEAGSNLVAGNLIGLNASGSAAIPNQRTGVFINNVANNTIGGTVPEARNVISGNIESGVYVQYNLAINNRILGNYIGLNAAGTAAIAGNSFAGIAIDGASTNTIGGSTASARNVIAGNSDLGLLIWNQVPAGNTATGNRVVGNYFGTNPAGSAAIVNGGDSIQVSGQLNATNTTPTNAFGNTIGGVNLGEGNLISGSGQSAITFLGRGSSASAVVGNTIGLNAAGTARLGAQAGGVLLQSSSNTVGGTTPGARNYIAGQSVHNILFTSADAKNNFVAGNYIGTNVAGTAGVGGAGMGVWVSGGTGNTIGSTVAGFGNLISGNGGHGLFLDSGSSTNRVVGNTIGLNAAGNAAVGNGSNGISGLYVLGPDNTIGGTVPGARNIISGNPFTNVWVNSPQAQRNLFAGNDIGTNAAGTAGFNETNTGLYLSAGSNNTIGSTVAGFGNLIAGNARYFGLQFASSLSFNNLAINNTLGMNAAGTATIPNGQDSLSIDGGSHDNTIGGTGANMGNRSVASAGWSAVSIRDAGGTGNLLLGNTIGLNGAGTATLGSGNGVYISSDHNTIGGTAPGSRNVIAGAGGYRGVWLNSSSSASNVVLGNYIGTTPDGKSSVGGGTGIAIDSGLDNTIGGSTASGAGNVISGGFYEGIGLTQQAKRNLIAGNLIGLKSDGSAALGNGYRGVFLDNSANNTIGGTVSTFRNVISGNGLDGIQFTNGSAANLVAGNYIGTNPAGTAAIPNLAVGVILVSGAHDNTVGGSSAGAGNLISGNSGDGVRLDGATTGSNLIAGNSIGLDVNGRSLGPAAVAWFQAEGNGTDPISGLTGTLGAGVTYTPGKVGQAFQFNGTATGVVTIPGSATGPLDLVGTDLTIEAWINQADASQPGNGNAEQVIFDKFYDTSRTGYMLSTFAGKLVLQIATTANPNFVLYAPTALPLNSWTHVAATYDGGTARIFVNGQEVASAALTGTILHNALAASIGNDNGGGGSYGFKGKIDELTVYARALDVLEIQSILTDGNAGKPNQLGNGGYGVQVIAAPGNTIGGLTATAGQGLGNRISANRGGAGIGVFGLAGGLDLNLAILGNAIGTDATGTRPEPNMYRGIGLYDGANKVTVGGAADGSGNLLSGNRLEGVFSGALYTTTSPAQALIQGNIIGLNRQGNAALGNVGSGIFLGGPNNTIGGSTPSSRNVISANHYAGIDARSAANLIAGNFIGTDATGGVALGNAFYGVSLYTATNNTIGGPTATPGTGSGNVISGNAQYGVYLVDPTTTGNLIQGNLIGLNASGTAALGTGSYGVLLASSTGNTIGGSTVAGAGNVIAGASDTGIRIDASGNLVAGNFVGLNAAGTVALRDGVYGLYVTGANNTIGGTSSAYRNVFNDLTSQVGVSFAGPGATGNILAGNYVGLNAAGTAALSNFQAVTISNASGNVIGGTVAGAGNAIAGGTALLAVYLKSDAESSTTGNLVAGNLVGLAAVGTAAALGTAGIYLDGAGTQANTIGGTTSAARNVIASGGSTGTDITIRNSASANLIVGNYIGVLADGATARGNLAGVRIVSAAFNNTIGGTSAAARNVISGHGTGVSITGVGTTGNVVVGNFIGTDAAGAAAVANTASGVAIDGGASSNLVGGATDGAGNLISGNAKAGVLVGGVGTVGTIIQGNLVGSNAFGTAAIANGGHGINLAAGSSGSTIGGTVSGAGNLTAGNVKDGIAIVASNGNLVQGNTSGLNLAGTAAIGNDSGLSILVGGSYNTIGGTSPAARNIFSGNRTQGVYVEGSPDATGNLILGNYIGLNASGLAVANNSEGIALVGGAVGTTVGGTATGAGNVISGNALVGVTIDGTATSGNLLIGNLIGLDPTGRFARPNLSGVAISGGSHNNTIGGSIAAARNVLSGNSQNGVSISGPGSSANAVVGNYIGLSAAGDAALPNLLTGVGIDNGASFNTVGGPAGLTGTGPGNVISGNGVASYQFGVAILGAQSTGNVIEGNLIGLNASGSATIANGWGVFLSQGTQGNRIGTDADGANDAAERNVISGNASDGVNFDDADSNLVAGNYIGTDIGGLLAVPNGDTGIAFYSGSANNTFGGTTAAARNIIAGNAHSGVWIYAAGTTGNVLAGNWIGLDAAGNALGNGVNGILALDGPSGNSIGLPVAGGGNVISGNVGDGIRFANDDPDDNIGGTLGASGNTIVNNRIGTDPTGLLARPNGVAGIELTAGSGTNTIGGTSASARNVISGNAANVFIHGAGTTNNVVLGNYIGTNAVGTAALGGSTYGVTIREGAANNTVGGLAPGAGNLVSGNYFGVDLSGEGGTGNAVLGNRIGTNALGMAAVPNYNGVVLSSSVSATTIGGTASGARNLISGNINDGVLIDGLSESSTRDIAVIGNFIGTNADGTAALANGSGVLIRGALGITIGGTSSRNLIAGNLGAGVRFESIQGATARGSVVGNYIGTDVTGANALPNGSGVELSDSLGVTIGGTASAARNVISGNSGAGILLSNSPGPIVGNYIGTDSTGTAAVGNATGLSLQGTTAATIGGTAFAARNVISGNRGDGVTLAADSFRNVILGNFIGTDKDATAAVGNLGRGVSLLYGGNVHPSTLNTVGGTAGGARNVISGNRGDGIAIVGAVASGTGDSILANLIGTDVFGTGALGNLGSGVKIDHAVAAVGGIVAGSGNTIANNGTVGAALGTSAGVLLTPGTSAAIVGNSFRNNAGLAIDEGAAGVTPNGLTIGSYSSNGVTTSTIGLSALGLTPGAQYWVDFYGVTDADSSGYGEGSRYLGRTPLVPDFNGKAAFSATLPVGLTGHQVITATITDPSNATSEFSRNYGGNQAPTAKAGSSFSTLEGTPVQFDGGGSKDVDGDPLTYTWTFGDGTTGAGRMPIHTYTTAGSFTVKLTVDDGLGGTATDTLSVQVSNVAPSLANTAWKAPTAPYTGGALYGSAVAVIGDVLAVAVPSQNAVQLIDAATDAVLKTLIDPSASTTSGFGTVLAAVSSGLAIGAPSANNGNGAAYLFDVNPLSPTFGQRLATLASPARLGDVNVRFGASLAGVGTRVVVGAPGLVTSAVGAATEVRPGGAIVFDANPGAATFGQRLLAIANPASGGDSDGFGAAVAALGTDILVGAPLADVGGTDSGAVWVISGATGQKNGGALTDPDFATSQAHKFGQTLAVVGGTIAVGAPNAANASAPGAGAVYLYGSTSRALLKTIRDPEPGQGGFGSALTATATSLLVGAPRSGLGTASAGAAYEYDGDTLSPTFGNLLRAVQAPAPQAGDNFGSALGYYQNSVLIGAPGTSGGDGRAFFFRASTDLGVSASTVTETDAGYRSVILSGQVSDPGLGESHTVKIDWMDGPGGTSNVETINLPVGIVRFAAAHRYDRDFLAARLVTVTVTDSLGASSLPAEAGITVLNVAPTIAELITGAGTLTEGDGIILSGRFTDPGVADTHTVTVDWGDGSPTYSFGLPAGTFSFDGGGDPKLRHIYRDNPSEAPYQYGLKVTVADETASGSRTQPVTVVNAAPSVSDLVLDKTSVDEGDTVTLSGHVFDPGIDDSHTLTIDWGDDTTQTVTLDPGSRANAANPLSSPFAISHLYANNKPGEAVSTFTVRVTSAVDDDGDAAPAIAALAEVVSNVLPTVKVITDPDLNLDPATIVLDAGVGEPGPIDRGGLTYSWVVTYANGSQVTGTDSRISFPRASKVGPIPVGVSYPSYTIALTVWDDIGSGSVRAVLIVGTDGPDLINLGSTAQFGPVPPANQGNLDEILVMTYGGDDTVIGGAATVPVLIDGGAGTDLLSGGDGDDTLTTGHGDDIVSGGNGNNLFQVTIGSSPTLINDGTNPAAINTIDLSRTAWALTVDLGITGVPQVVDGTKGDTLQLVGQFQNLVGTSYDDRLFGNDDNNEIRGGGGDDLLFGGAGNDTVISGSKAGGKATLGGGTGSDIIFGGAGNDTLGAGSFGPNMVYTPGNGNSTLIGGSGEQVLFGGGGNDSIRTGGNKNTVGGGGGADVIFGGAGEDTLAAGSFDPSGVYTPLPGPSTIFGGSGHELIFGGSTGSTLVSGSSPLPGSPGTTIVGGAGADVIFGGGGRDSIHAGDGDNTVVGGAQTEVIFGGRGNDSIVGASSPGTKTTIAGGGGRDIIFAGLGDDTLAAGTFDPSGVFLPGSGLATLVGGAGADLLYGGSGGSTLVSGSKPGGTKGNTLIGGAGADLIFGGGGRDSIHAGDGNNTIIGGTGPDVIFGGKDRDSIVGGSRPGGGSTIAGGGGPDIIFGGQGNDLIASGTFGDDGAFQGGSGGSTLIAGDGDTTLLGGASGDLIYGGAGNDSVVSGSTSGGRNTVIGGGGKDVIFGGAGDDTIDAGLGDDSIFGGAGSQLLFGGPGNDTIISGSKPGGSTPKQTTLAGASGNDIIFGGLGSDSLDGGSGDDSLYAGTGTAILDGGAGNDLVAGGTFTPDGVFHPTAGTNTLAGGGGNDIIFGGTGPTTMGAGSFPSGGVYMPGQGNATLFGGSRSDVIYGGLGNDYLVGGTGAGLLDGNAGNDTIFAGGPNATLRGGSGNDTLRGGSRGDILFGDDGDDAVMESGNLDFALSNDALVGTDTRGVTVIEDQLHDIQRAAIVGGDGANRLDASGFAGPVSLSGGAGDDTLIGATLPGALGPNTLNGGAGNDSLVAGSVNTTFVFSGENLGSDVIAHGLIVARNQLDFSGLKGGVTIDLGASGPQTVSPAGLVLTLPDGRTIQDAVGSSYDDFIVGNDLPNLLIGGAGRDELVGRGGDNTLIGGDTQAVFLDFDSLGGPDLHVYTQPERDQIQARLTVLYAAFAYTFTQTRPQTGAYTTISFNDPGLYGLEAGKADSIDWRNLDRNDDVTVNVNGLLGRDGQPAATSANFVAITITVAAHELGHDSGLKHADSYGPIGSGIYAGVDPTAYVDEVDESDPANPVVLSYPGPQGADETPYHILASGASVHTSLDDATGQTYFGTREAIKIAYSQQGTPTEETLGAHNAPASAQDVTLAPLAVPNTNERGIDVGLSFDVKAADVVSHIGIDPLTGKAESDFYRFDAQAGAILNVDIYSASLSRDRLPNPIDSIVRVYLLDDAGAPHLVPYHDDLRPGRVAVNDNGFQGLDSSLVDLVLPATGHYLVEVDTYNPPGGADQDTGDYELFLYTFARGGGVTGGDSLFGGSAQDTIIGDTTGGTISAQPKTDVVLPGSGGTTYVENVAPQFVASGADRSVTENSLVVLHGTYFEPDDGDVNTFLWQAKDDKGLVVATGTAQDFAFVAAEPITYTVTFSVFDGHNTSSSTTRVTVANAPPIVVPPQTPKVVATEGVAATIPLGSFTDGTADGPWTVTVAWGDGQRETFTATTPGSLGSRSHTYANNAAGGADYLVSVSVTDAQGGEPGPDGVKSFPVSVVNKAPVVSAGGDLGLVAPALLSRTGSFADVIGDGPWTGTVDYGDGSGVQTLATIDQAARTFTLNHPYARGGQFPVTVRIKDKDGAEGVATFAVTATGSLTVATVGPIVRYTKSVISSVSVVFSAAIDPKSFTVADLTLTKNGVAVPLIGASISAVSKQPSKYTVKLGSLAKDSAEYVLTVRASGVTDPAGVPGSGSSAVVWTRDLVRPTSRVSPLAARQTSTTFAVTATGSDANGSGIASYALYVSIDGKSFAPWKTVPADAPTALYTAQSNHTYSFRSVATDNLGNVESKKAVAESTTFVPDLTAPSTAVVSVTSSSSTFGVTFLGTDTGGSGLASIEVFAQVDNRDPTSLGIFPLGSIYTPYQAIADGSAHTYRFFTEGRDNAGNVEAAPTAPSDVVVSATFAHPNSTQVASFQVQKGAFERSYIRYLDLLLNRADDLAAIAGSIDDDIANNDRVVLTKYALLSKGPSVSTTGTNISLKGKLAAGNLGLSFDFGTQGITGSASSTSGDGLYVLRLDLDGDGTFETEEKFYRLLGDLDSTRGVGDDDVALIDLALASGLYFPGVDVNGDGVVNSYDKTLITRSKGRTIAFP